MSAAAPRVYESLDALRPLGGQEAGVSGWFTVSQDVIDRFAGAVEDRQWIHVDAERARRESPYHSTIGHGFLTLSLTSHLSREAVELRGPHTLRVNYGLNRVRFIAPVAAGARVRAHLSPQSVSDNQVIWQVTMEIEGQDKPAMVAEWITRYA
jgi:acyl dehydratase